MRLVVLIVAFVIASIASTAPRSVSAAPYLAVGTQHAAPAVLERVGYWRRYCAVHDCVGNAAHADVHVDVGVHAPVVPVAPPLPGHCGEYHYWDVQTEACLDARYHNP